MEESRGIASSPATRMEIAQEALRNPSEEWFISILDCQQPDPEDRSKHRILKAPVKFRLYEKQKKYFDPQVVSLGPYNYHRRNNHLKPMEKHKITAAKQFFDQFTNVTGGMGGIYKKFKVLTGDLKECYDAKAVAELSDHVIFERMMFLDGCFVLHFIENIMKGGKTELEISNNLIPLIIRDMFLMENQLPFKVLDKLMNLRWGSSSSVSSSSEKPNIVDFIKLKVLIPMGFYPLNYSRSFEECIALTVEHDRPLHLLNILRTILLDSPTRAEMHSYRPRNFGSVMKPKEIGIRFENRRPRDFASVTELKEIGIRFKKGYMESLMDISFEEHLLFPRLLLPTMYINDTTISQLLNLTALEACSDTYSGCGVTCFIQFMDSLINDNADVKMLRSKGILHHSLGSDDELALLFNTWPADVTNDLPPYRDISMQICRHRDRTVKISIATWVDKYFGSPWTAISFVAASLLLVFTAFQTYFTAFPRR